MKTAATRTWGKRLGTGMGKKELVPPGRGDLAFGDARGVQVVADRKVRSILFSVSLHAAHQCFCVKSGSFWEECQGEGYLMTSGDIN